jgi:L-alanine-DL-glutamate epimerase-like enolase superfamily enzyme
MKIASVDVVLHERRSSLAVFGVRDGRLPMGVLRIRTDEGLEGNAFLSYPGPGPAAIAEQVVRVAGPLLTGEEALDVGRHWRRLAGLSHFLHPIACGVVDVALWDLAGKAAGLPIHRLLGSCRDRVPVYFSSGHHASAGAYADEALHWKAQGWKGYKLHPPRAPWLAPPAPPLSVDIEACSAVRDAVGPGMALMLDSSWSYTYPQALEVGRAIEELGYLWYEDPLPANALEAYVRLKQQLHIPILATEITPGGLEALTPWVTAGATDHLRGDVIITGGITGLLKVAHLAEAFGMSCEIHDGYNALGNVANLHVMMAIDNCDWFEVLAFNRSGEHGLEHLSYGLAEPLTIDGDGMIHAPEGPGLGVQIDWELINSAVERVVG